VAKHFLSAGILNIAMQNRQIKRVYNAIVKDKGRLSDADTIDLPIAREDDTLIKRKVSSDGQRAVTQFKVLQRFEKYSLIESLNDFQYVASKAATIIIKITNTTLASPRTNVKINSAIKSNKKGIFYPQTKQFNTPNFIILYFIKTFLNYFYKK